MRKRRLDLHLPQRDVANLVGAERQTVAGWETRGLRPAPGSLEKVAEFLGYVPEPAAAPGDLVQRLIDIRRQLRLARSEVEPYGLGRPAKGGQGVGRWYC